MHQEVRGVTDTAAFKLMGEILHHLDDLTAQLNTMGQYVASMAEEVALINSRGRGLEKTLAGFETIAQGVKAQAETNARVIEELRKRLG